MIRERGSGRFDAGNGTTECLIVARIPIQRGFGRGRQGSSCQRGSLFRIIGPMSDGTGNQSPPGQDITQLLHRAADGDTGAVEALLPLVYEELRARAGAYFRGQPANHTLQPTAVVHEAYLKLVNSQSAQWNSRAHFCAVAATAMRQILADHARRRRLAQQAREDRAEEVTLIESPSRALTIDLLALDDVLAKLAQVDARQARLVELRFFGGLSVEDAAAVLGVSDSTVKKEWRSARAWLSDELEAGGPS